MKYGNDPVNLEEFTAVITNLSLKVIVPHPTIHMVSPAIQFP